MACAVVPHPQLIFLSKTWFFGIYLNFQWQISFLNQYPPHSESKSYQINSIKSCSSRSFQKHQRHIPILPKRKIQLRFNLIFSEEIIQYTRNFCTSRPNTMKPSQCTPPRETFPKRPSTGSEVDLITTNKTNLNKQTSTFLH